MPASQVSLRSMRRASAACIPLVSLAPGRRNVPTVGLAGPQRDERLGELHGGLDRIDHRHGDAMLDAVRQAGERRAREDDDIGLRVGDESIGKLDQKVRHLVAHLQDRRERAAERVHAGAARLEAVHLDAVLIPGLQGLGERHDGELAAEHAGRQHRRLRHADDGDVEQLARAEQAGIAEGGDDGAVGPAVMLGQHLEHDRAADLRLRPAGDVGEAAGGGQRDQRRSRRRDLDGGIVEPSGDAFAGVRIGKQNAHRTSGPPGKNALGGRGEVEDAAIATSPRDDLQTHRQTVAAQAAGERKGRRQRVIEERREHGVRARRDSDAADGGRAELCRGPGNARGRGRDERIVLAEEGGNSALDSVAGLQRTCDLRSAEGEATLDLGADVGVEQLWSLLPCRAREARQGPPAAEA